MNNFDFCTPTRVVFGVDTEDRTGELIKDCGGSRVLVLYGGGSVVRSGLLARVEASIKNAGLDYLTIGGVQPNPRVAFAEEARAKAVAFGTDFIMSVGGGSVIDTAKAVAHGTANPEHTIWDIWTKKVPLTKSVPIGNVITIPAAGSEMSDSAVLTNEELGLKNGLSTPFNRCKFSIMNPAYVETLPPYQMGAGIADIMMHTIERYFTPGDPCLLTDEIAEGLLRTVVGCGRRVLEGCVGTDAIKPDREAIGEIMWAAALSHNDLTHVGRTRDMVVHKFGHALSARFDVTHGASLAAVWGSWALFVYKNNPERFAQYAEKVWGITEGSVDDKAKAGIAATVAYFKEIGMPTSLTDLGVAHTDEDLKALALNTTQNGTVKVGKLMALGEEEAEAIFRMAI
ncbi:MAG: iron-containing alcohol dehydrogenase [Lachnospiraceae bacterium]|nr:iron-containing alcohol dehydrogenase [Lachnospiraceae bacterium]